MTTSPRRTGLGLVAVALAVLAATALPASAAGAPPVAVGDAYSGRLGHDLVVGSPGVLANDTDADGDVLTARLGSSSPSYGTVDLRADGSFTYTPSPFNPGYDWFFYEAFDGTSWSASGQVILTLYGDPVGGADRYGVLGAPYLFVQAPQGLLVNDTGQPPLSSWLAKRPRSGWVFVAPNGAFLYIPRPGFVGTDRFTYWLRDGAGTVTTPIAVDLTIARTNTAPVAIADTYQVFEDGSLDIGAPGLLANDHDAEGQTLRAELVGSPSVAVDLREDGSFTYVPELNQDRDDSFSYRVTDGFTWSEPVLVTLDVIAVNDPPEAHEDFYAVERDTVLTVAAPGVLANDADEVEFDGPLVHGLVTPPAHGHLTLEANGAFTYVPDAGYVGSDVFVYRVGDVGGPGGTASVELDVYEPF